jgi:hypothetical protein
LGISGHVFIKQNPFENIIWNLADEPKGETYGQLIMPTIRKSIRSCICSVCQFRSASEPGNSGVTRILKGGRFLKNPGFTRSISMIFFCVADFHGQFQRLFPKGVVHVPRPPDDAHGRHDILRDVEGSM